MSARHFLDTNIFVYSFDDRDLPKRDRARELVAEALATGTGCISFQVIQEFINVATRKFSVPLRTPDCARYLETVLAPLCDVMPTIALYHAALDLKERWQLGFFDALVVASALECGCDRLLSEDLQHGQRIRSLVIENPFRST